MRETRGLLKRSSKSLHKDIEGLKIFSNPYKGVAPHGGSLKILSLSRI
jgi:hypothetical protein